MNVIETNFTYTKSLIPLDINNVEYVVLHHPEAVIASPEDIHQWHLQNGWSGFGYNEYIRKDGTVYIGRGDYIGAQCQGYNSISYGICCEGDYNKELLMPEIQKKALIERISINKVRFPKYKMSVPHSLLYSTECPGKYFPLKEILTRLEVNNMEENKVHWAQEHYDYLKSQSIEINETRFEDSIKRGELFALLAQIVKMIRVLMK